MRQHPPRLGALRDALEERRPSNLAEGVAQASASLGEFLGELEERPGVVDRRFYAICQKARADELQGLLTRAGFAVFPLKDRALRLLVESTLRGCAPPAPSSESPMVIGLSRGQLDIGERLGRSYQLTRWPRTLPLGYMQRVLALGLPMDLSIHISPIATAQAVRTLEWQRVKMESGIAISLRRDRTASPETEIALEERIPAQGRGAPGQGAPVQRLFLHHHLRRQPRINQGAGAAAKGPLRRVDGHPGTP